MNLIRRLIGWLTMPENIYEYGGDFYIYSTAYIPGMKQRFQYQELSRGFWGNWRKKTAWLGVNEPLVMCIDKP